MEGRIGHGNDKSTSLVSTFPVDNMVTTNIRMKFSLLIPIPLHVAIKGLGCGKLLSSNFILYLVIAGSVLGILADNGTEDKSFFEV